MYLRKTCSDGTVVGKKKDVVIENKKMQMFILDKSKTRRGDWLKWSVLRSCVYNADGRLLSISPPTSYPRGNRIPMLINGAERFEEFVDGTMINLFWNEEWIIATKSCIGGANFFNLTRSGETMTFKEMFDDVLSDSSQAFYNELERIRNSNPDHSLCLSFVLQHPQNRIISPIMSKKLCLVGCYHIHSSTSTIHCMNAEALSSIANSLPECVTRPVIYSHEESAQMLCKMYKNHLSYEVKGLIKYLPGGFYREKAINPNYKAVERLKGNCSNVGVLKKNVEKKKRLSEFLSKFPELA